MWLRIASSKYFSHFGLESRDVRKWSLFAASAHHHRGAHSLTLFAQSIWQVSSALQWFYYSFGKLHCSRLGGEIGFSEQIGDSSSSSPQFRTQRVNSLSPLDSKSRQITSTSLSRHPRGVIGLEKGIEHGSWRESDNPFSSPSLAVWRWARESPQFGCSLSSLTYEGVHKEGMECKGCVMCSHGECPIID